MLRLDADRGVSVCDGLTRRDFLHAGALQLWQGEGLLLGVFDAHFSDRTHRLAPGDKVLLYSDGIDGARFEDRDPGTASLLACAERHRALPIQDFVQGLAHDLFRAGNPPDDLTLLGLEMLGP